MSERDAAGRARRALAIVSVGNELLFGETVDTNAAWLARTFTEWGFVVTRGWTVRDVAEEIQDAVRAAVDAADVVVVTGGLGPTDDDLTKSAVADALGLGLVVDDATRKRVRERFRAGGHDDTPGISAGQSELPEGSVALPNEAGTAPGILLEHDDAALVLLPGVPSEMKGIVSGPLRAELEGRDLLGARVHHRVIHTTGIAESHLAERVEPVWRELEDRIRADVGLAFLPDELGVDLRLSAVAESDDAARARLDRIEKALAPVVSEWRFEADSGDVVEAVSAELLRLGFTLAVAESCTGGLLATRITERAGASDVFVGGVVAYDNAVKVGQLGVEPETLERDGAVSEGVARQMAAGVVERLGTDAGLSLTGVAGPGGGSEEKPVGTVWIGCAVEGRVEAVRRRFPGDRGSVRRRSAQAALALLLRRLEEIDVRA